MNKFILLSFLLTVLAANTDATVAPFSCYYTTPGKGSSEPPALSAQNCVTACYRVTATGGIPTGANDATNKNPSNSINGVINTLVGSGDINAVADQRTKVIGVGIQSKVGVKPNGAAPGSTELGVATLGNIGIITLPAEGTAGLKDFVLNDRGCLPIPALPPTPQAQALDTTGTSNQAGFTIGRTCTGTLNAVTGICSGVSTCSFGSTDATGCLSGLAQVSGDSLLGTIIGKNTAARTSGSDAISETTHIKQQIPIASSFSGAPLQLAYNPIIGTAPSGGVGKAIAIPAPELAALQFPNILANAQVNQVALDLQAVTVLFCVTSGVCCTSNACNTIPVVTTKSSSTSLNNNIIIILMSIICSMSF